MLIAVDGTAGCGYDRTVAPRPGEIWRTADGRLLVIAEVSGDMVSGDIAPVELGGNYETLGPGSGAVHYAGTVRDFDAFKLIGPRWKATFTAAVTGPHPTVDEVFAVVQTLGSVEGRLVGAVTGSAMSQGARYELKIYALTAAEVQQRLDDALREFGGLHDLVVERTDGPPPIIVGA